MTDFTPNLQLEKIAANRKTWADDMNRNLTLIDAAVGAYFAIQNLQGVWENSRAYTVGQTVVDEEQATVWQCQVDHISAGIPTTFAEERVANPTYWTVYSSPARARGAWTPLTSYAVNDFVISGSKYAVCIVSHTSSINFDADMLDGKWSVLVDLSQVGSQVLPVPGGAADANKFVVTPATGLGYTIAGVAAVLTMLGTTTVGQALLQAADAAAARTAISAQVAGSYQTANATLAALSGQPTQAYGIALLNLANVAALIAAASPLTTNGDLYARLAGVDSRLPVGGANELLGVVAGLPAWRTLTAQLDTLGTTQGSLLYRNGTVWTPLTPAADAYKGLFSGGAGANPAFAGTWKVLGEATPSVAGTVDFTGIPSTIKHIRVLFRLLPTTNAVHLLSRISIGAAFKNATSYGVVLRSSASNTGSVAAGSASASALVLSDPTYPVSNNATYGGVSGSLDIFDLQNAAYPRALCQSTWGPDAGAAGVFWTAHGGGCWQGAGPVDGIRLLFSSGNIASGRVLLLGMSN